MTERKRRRVVEVYQLPDGSKPGEAKQQPGNHDMAPLQGQEPEPPRKMPSRVHGRKDPQH